MLPQTAGRGLTTHAPARPIYLPQEADTETLAEATGDDRHLRTYCACGEVAALDVDAWLARGLGFKAVVEFSGSLRCPCGRRHARFEIWPGALSEACIKIRSAASLYD